MLAKQIKRWGLSKIGGKVEFEFPKICPWCGSCDIVIIEYVSEYRSEICRCTNCDAQLAREPILEVTICVPNQSA